MTILFQCRKCGFQAASLEGHKCAAAAPDPPSRVDLDIPAARLEKARAALARVEAPVAKEAFREAAIHGQAFVQDGRVLKREEVLAPPLILAQSQLGPNSPAKEEPGFDRAAYQKAYMKTYMKDYMRGWRARRKAGQ